MRRTDPNIRIFPLYSSTYECYASSVTRADLKRAMLERRVESSGMCARSQEGAINDDPSVRSVSKCLDPTGRCCVVFTTRGVSRGWSFRLYTADLDGQSCLYKTKCWT